MALEPVSYEAFGLGAAAFSLGNSDAMLDAVARHSGDCIKIIDLDGRVLRWNAACEDLYGWNAHEVLGKKLPFIPEQERLGTIRDMRDVASRGEIVEREARSLRADGSLIMLRSVVMPLHDSDGHPAGTLALTREYGHDTRLTRQREDFAAVVSRQLRDPVTAIFGFTQLLQRSEILDDPHRRERTVRALAERTTQLSTLLDDLLVVFEFDKGGLSLTLEPVDPGVLLGDVLERATPHEARLLLDYDPTLAGIVVDRQRIVQAVSCLVDNALRFSPATAMVGVSIYCAGEEIVIEVADTGCGIEPAEQSLIFDRFYAGAAMDAWPGVGIGLYLVRVIASAHGGTVAVASRLDSGSTFTLRIPCSSN